MTHRRLTDRDYQALSSLRAAMRRFLAFSERAARDAGVTPAQHQLLLAVRGHPLDGDPSITDLADVLLRRRHSVVELVDRAETAGLVVSTSDPGDGRRRLVRLTPAAEAIVERLSVIHRAELTNARTALDAILDDLA